MTKNLGVVDRGIRTIAALVFTILIVTQSVTGATAIVLGILAVVLLVTSFVSFCPLYFAFKMSTRRKTE
jgi:hypothetical protein